MEELKQSIKNLAEVYSANLKGKIAARQEEMKADDNSHYLDSGISRLFDFQTDVIILKSLELQAKDLTRRTTNA